MEVRRNIMVGGRAFIISGGVQGQGVSLAVSLQRGPSISLYLLRETVSEKTNLSPSRFPVLFTLCPPVRTKAHLRGRSGPQVVKC